MGKKSLLSFEYQLPQDLLPVHSEAHGFGMLLTSFEGLDIVVMTAVVVVAVVSSLLLLLLVLLLLLLLQLPLLLLPLQLLLLLSPNIILCG